jgi:uncharacterized RDD family membrane protein YckC
MESGSPPPEQPPPSGPQAPTPGPQAPQPGYAPIPGGPETPPSGWHQPVAPALSGWEGKPLASWGSRVGATLIDWLVLLIPTVILFVVVVAGTIGVSGDDDASTGAAIAAILLYVVLVCVLLLFYAPVLMMRKGPHNGQTLGKQLVGITVVRNTGQEMNFAWAALREVVIKGLAVGIASSIIPLLPWLLDVLWPLWDDENRALHDLAAQTHVVRT